jgi:hypothetical protein
MNSALDPVGTETEINISRPAHHGVVLKIEILFVSEACTVDLFTAEIIIGV